MKDEANVFFDIYTWNNGFGYTYKGNLIFLDGSVFNYDLPRDAGFNPTISYKLNYTSSKVKTLSDEMLRELHTLFDPLKKSCVKNPEVLAHDAPHIHYYGYHSVDYRVHLRERDTHNCDYDDSTTQRNVDKLISMLDMCVTPSIDLTCVYCVTKGASKLLLIDEGVQVYCNELCMSNFSNFITLNSK